MTAMHMDRSIIKRQTCTSFADLGSLTSLDNFTRINRQPNGEDDTVSGWPMHFSRCRADAKSGVRKKIHANRTAENVTKTATTRGRR